MTGLALSAKFATMVDGKFTPSTDADTLDKFKCWLLTTFSTDVAIRVDTTVDAPTLLALLEDEFGYGLYDKISLKDAIRSLKLTTADPSDYLVAVHHLRAIFIAAGGLMSDTELLEIVVETLRDSNPTFWHTVINSILDNPKTTFQEAKRLIRGLWLRFHAPKLTAPKLTAHNVGQAPVTKPKPRSDKRGSRPGLVCNHCLHSGVPSRARICTTHSTEDCTNPSQAPVIPVNQNVGVPPAGEIKAAQQYSQSPVFHDSGATSHFFKDAPYIQYRAVTKPIYTAGSDDPPHIAVGVGAVNLGNIQLHDVLHVPTFERNLVSGVRLMQDGYTQVISPDGTLQVFNSASQIVATGRFDASQGLIKFDSQEVASSAVSPSAIHARLGHPCTHVTRKTLPACTGLTLQGDSNLNDLPLCEFCVLGKSTAAHAPKLGTQPTAPLEVIYADTHVCSLIGSRGMHLNVKLQDGLTGYIHTYFVPNQTADAAFEPFLTTVKRWERLTGHKHKYFRTDGGGEFEGKFNDYYSQEGVTHQITLPYTHNSHGKVERAHRSITATARALLLASNLPKKYYDEAIIHATYLYNRTVHGKHTKTPYELFRGKPPNLSHLKPFGCVGYAFIPPEKRSKLDPTTERCRLLGYGGDGGEESKAFWLLRESDHSKFLAYDVKFDESVAPPALPNVRVSDDESDGDDIFGDADYHPCTLR